MVSHEEIRNSNSQITEAHTPKVAVFVGGTAGIGKAALTALVSVQVPIKVYAVGRNSANFEPVLRQLKLINPRVEIIFLEGQVAVLDDVKRLCIEIRNREDKIDLLFLSAGFLPFGERQETSEGFETSLALLYWSRVLLVQNLLPLLRAASLAPLGYNPRVISILGGGFESPSIPLDDIDLRKPQNFGLQAVARQAATLNTLILATLAGQSGNQDIVFIHNHPGEVKTEIFRNGWGKRKPDLSLVKNGMSLEESGDRSLYLMTSAQFGGKGVPLPEETDFGLTVEKTERGALFCVDERLHCIQQELVLEQLKQRNAVELVWEETFGAIAPYIITEG